MGSADLTLVTQHSASPKLAAMSVPRLLCVI